MNRSLLILLASVMITAPLSLSPMAMAAETPGHEAYEAALKSMHQAEDELGRTGEDASGHKAKALEHLRQAIGQTDAAAADSELKHQK